MPTLFLTCGLPGSGKTTLAKRIEQERPALRLTADEWLFALFGPEPGITGSDEGCAERAPHRGRGVAVGGRGGGAATRRRRRRAIGVCGAGRNATTIGRVQKRSAHARSCVFSMSRAMNSGGASRHATRICRRARSLSKSNISTCGHPGSIGRLTMNCGSSEGATVPGTVAPLRVVAVAVMQIRPVWMRVFDRMRADGRASGASMAVVPGGRDRDDHRRVGVNVRVPSPDACGDGCAVRASTTGLRRQTAHPRRGERP